MKSTKQTPFTKTYNVKENNLSIIDNLVYAALHTYRNNTTYKCNPTMKQLSDKLNLSLPTIKQSIDKLSDIGFIHVEQTKQGNKINNYYYLPDIRNFTKIPLDFISNPNYNAKLKAYTIAFRNLFFNDSLKCKYSNTDIANLLGIDKRTSDKYIKEMITNNLLTFDNGTYSLNEAVINWRLTKLEIAVEHNTTDINQLKQELAEMKQRDMLREKEMQELKSLLYMQLKGKSKSKPNYESNNIIL